MTLPPNSLGQDKKAISIIGLEHIVFIDTYDDIDINTIIFDVRLNVKYILKKQLEQEEIVEAQKITFFLSKDFKYTL